MTSLADTHVLARAKGPLRGSYVAAAAMVVLALIPYLALSSALQPVTPIILKQLHLSQQALSLTTGMANAAYAIGTVLAVQFAQHLPQRRMLVAYAVLLVLGSVMAAWSPVPGLFIAGHILQGLCTSLMLIAAVPPLVIGWPVAKLRWTATIMNMCIFGAVALGPVIGGLQAAAHQWRPLFWAVAGISLLALVLTLLTYEDAPPQDRSAPWDTAAVGLAAAGCACAFFGASELLTHPLLDISTFVPLLAGLALIVVLIVHQYMGRHPLLTVRSLATTIPIAGITAAICAASASVSAIAVVSALVSQGSSPLHVGLLFIPEFGGAVLMAVVFGAVFRTRFIHLLALAGVLFISAGIVVLAQVLPPTQTLTLVGSGLIGIGVGGAVAPALFIAGFSLSSNAVQRVFALVELLRAVAAFMIAPILMHVAVTVGGSPQAGSHVALWICFGVSTGGALVSCYLYILGRARPQAPDLERWQQGDAPAWHSPPLLAGIRNDCPAPGQLVGASR